MRYSLAMHPFSSRRLIALTVIIAALLIPASALAARSLTTFRAELDIRGYATGQVVRNHGTYFRLGNCQRVSIGAVACAYTVYHYSFLQGRSTICTGRAEDMTVGSHFATRVVSLDACRS
jgi:hypothetical protein